MSVHHYYQVKDKIPTLFRTFKYHDRQDMIQEASTALLRLGFGKYTNAYLLTHARSKGFDWWRRNQQKPLGKTSLNTTSAHSAIKRQADVQHKKYIFHLYSNDLIDQFKGKKKKVAILISEGHTQRDAAKIMGVKRSFIRRELREMSAQV